MDDKVKHVAIVGAGRESLPWFWPSAPEIWGVKYVTLALIKTGYKVNRSYWLDDINSIKKRYRDDGTYELLRDWPYAADTQLVMGNQAWPDEFPHLEVFDLLKFATEFGSDYINGSGALAFCDAILKGYQEIDLHGFDFVPEENRMKGPRVKELKRQAECIAFWMGYCKAKGIKVRVNPMSPLLESKFRALHGISIRGVPYSLLGELPTTNQEVYAPLLEKHKLFMQGELNPVSEPAEQVINLDIQSVIIDPNVITTQLITLSQEELKTITMPELIKQ